MKKYLQRGFSLAELAVAMVIVAILSAGALSALRVQTERARFAEANAFIEEAREALLNFAAVTGSLPCPDTSTNGTAGVAGTCASSGVQHGSIPWKTLGVAQADPWGQPLRYAVHVKFTNVTTVTLIAESDLKILRESASGSTEDLANNKVVVMALWSSGPDALSKTSGTPANEVFAEAPDSDDIVSWLSRYILIGRMLEAGRDVAQGTSP